MSIATILTALATFGLLLSVAVHGILLEQKRIDERDAQNAD